MRWNGEQGGAMKVPCNEMKCQGCKDSLLIKNRLHLNQTFLGALPCILVQFGCITDAMWVQFFQDLMQFGCNTGALRVQF